MGVFVGVSDERALKAIRLDLCSWDAYGSRADVGSAIIDYSKLLLRNRSCEVRSILCLEEHDVCIPTCSTTIWFLEPMHGTVESSWFPVMSRPGVCPQHVCGGVASLPAHCMHRIGKKKHRL